MWRLACDVSEPEHRKFELATSVTLLETSAAIVFSSSLLHEPLNVTTRRRFILFAFLRGEH
jgi:hypothetical protein